MSANDVNPLEATVHASRFTPVCCYLYGVLGAVAFLNSEPYKRDRSIRFHSCQSIMFFHVLRAVDMWILVRLISFLSPLALQVGRRVEIGCLGLDKTRRR